MFAWCLTVFYSPICWPVVHHSFSCSVPLSNPSAHTLMHTYKLSLCPDGEWVIQRPKQERCRSSPGCPCCCFFSSRCVCVFQVPTSPRTWTVSRLSSHPWCATGCAMPDAATTTVRRETLPLCTVKLRSSNSSSNRQRARASDSVSADSRPFMSACLRLWSVLYYIFLPLLSACLFFLFPNCPTLAICLHLGI